MGLPGTEHPHAGERRGAPVRQHRRNGVGPALPRGRPVADPHPAPRRLGLHWYPRGFAARGAGRRGGGGGGRARATGEPGGRGRDVDPRRLRRAADRVRRGSFDRARRRLGVPGDAGPQEPVPVMARAPRPARRPADKAREGGAPTGRTGAALFRPKRNEERSDSAGMHRPPLPERGGSPAQTPERKVRRAELADLRFFWLGNAARLPEQAPNSLWWNPAECRERRGARLTRRVREEYLVYFDRNATQNGAKRSGSDGMDRRSNAAWVSPQAVKAAAR